jgi:arylsulfatase A-like enzyme
MPWSGYPRPIAPNLTQLAARAVRYTHAYALSSYTSMSVGGFLGGRLPGELARSGYFFGHYPDSVVMFPERLRAAGVRTLAVQAHFYFRPGSAGFEQGFDVWQMVPGIRQNNTTDMDVTDDRQEAMAERLLADPVNTSGRFFAWFHFMGPHDEYIAHPGIGPYGPRMRDRYDAEVTFTDQQVGRLLDFVRRQPWGARTAVIVTADHGEAFGEHQHYRHGFELWQELVHVPWMFVVPGAAPRAIDASRGHIDLAPTVLELLGVPRPPAGEMPGQSLLAELRGGPAPERDVWVDLPRTSDSDRRRALIHGRFKLIAYGDDERFEVYDLAVDPTESHNLRATDRAAYDDMVARYRAGQASIHDVHPYQARNLRGAPPGRGW